jgi:hypothetical protein
MKKISLLFAALLISTAITAQHSDQNSLSYKMEELTSPRFARAVEAAKGVCNDVLSDLCFFICV